jgi:hypothetical protein
MLSNLNNELSLTEPQPSQHHHQHIANNRFSKHPLVTKPMMSIASARTERLQPTSRYAKSAAPTVVGVAPTFTARRSTSTSNLQCSDGDDRMDELVSDSNLALYKYLLNSGGSSVKPVTTGGAVVRNSGGNGDRMSSGMRPSVFRNQTKNLNNQLSVENSS